MSPVQNNNLPLSVSAKAVFVRYHLILTVLFLVLLLVGGYFLVIKPKLEMVWQSSGDNIKVLRSEKVKREAYLVQLQDISRRYRQFDNNQLGKFDQLLPAESDIPGLFVQLQNLTSANSLFLSNVTFNEAAPETGEKNGGIRRLSIGLNVVGSGQGSYEQLKTFIAALEKNLRLFDIQAVYFSPGSPNYSLTLTAYYFKE